ncbi:MAG TPA: tetratricopeptide repeat protein [Longimicrobiales bacterium]
MHRAAHTALSVAIALVAFAPSARAQEPPRTKDVKEAEKFMASAMTAQDTAERRSRFERALNPLRIAATKDPSNARVWVAMGQAYAGLHDAVHADSAFRKAQELYPGFADEINNLRLGGWADAFNAGVALMDAQKYEEAIVVLQGAELFNSTRPESKMNLGALYANKGDAAQAEQHFRAAWAITEGPEKAKLKPEDAANWTRYAALAKLSVAQMVAQRGVEGFEAQKYDDAIKYFKEAHELNPVARDYTYNLAQSLYAKATPMEQRRQKLADEEKAARARKDASTAKAKADEAAAISKELLDMYAQVEPLTVAAREMDPMNEDLFLLQARSYRIRGDLVSDAATRSTYMSRVNDLLTLHDAMPVEVTGIAVGPGTPESTVKGQVKNRKLKAGDPVKVHFTLLGMDGASIGEQDIMITAPAVGQTAPFEVKVKTSGDVAGWKYAIGQ